MTKIYLSGGMKGPDWQSIVINSLNPDCFIFFNPRSHGLSNPSEYTSWDLHFVKNCDVVLAYMSAENPSGYGLALEVGYAIGLNKTVIIVDEKSRLYPDFKRRFQIIHESPILSLPSLNDAINHLKSYSI